MNRIILKMKRHKSDCLKSIFGNKLVDFAEKQTPYKVPNYIDGSWSNPDLQSKFKPIPNPITGKESFSIVKTSPEEIAKIKTSMEKCPKSGLFNPLKNPSMYRKWGQIIFKVAEKMHEKEVEEFFKRVLFNCVPKSVIETHKEYLVTRQGVENFCGDNPRFALKGFVVAGDREGQESVGYRFPYGPTAIISPFNFPMEIPVLQFIGAAIAGNKTLLKTDIRTAPVMEAFTRLLEFCGMPKESIILANFDRDDSSELFKACENILRLVQFTGSSAVAEHLVKQFHGKVRIEDSGFNWKILGHDVSNVDYVVSQIDQDSFATSGQKCSCQRIMFVHENWKNADIYEKIKKRVSTRNFKDLTIMPVLSVSNKDMDNHVQQLLKIPGSKLLIGGKKLAGEYHVPSEYGLYEPTIVHVPLSQFFSAENQKVLFKEIFGPVLITTDYNSSELEKIVELTEKMQFHLTAGIVSNDPTFVNYFAKNTVNGVTYVGIKGRTTGAPQNHFFGPGNDPRGAGIGTIEAIINTWTCHREVIYDYGSLGEEKISEINQS